MKQYIGYRHDVDGLRAVAVMLVILFHLDVAAISGGFVGVDVFYVISGFVIFRTMLVERDSGRFSILNFYRRRIRRIFPALAVVVLFTLVVGSVILTPGEYESLSYSTLAAIFSVSNIYFNDRLGYFADSASSTPLIHTWSLGVEEQFYLVAPFFLLACASRFGSRGLFRGLIALCVVSFAYNLLAVYGLNNEKHAFYLPMSRFWEIGVGGILAFIERRVVLGRNVSNVLVVIGSSGVVASGWLIDNTVPFPAFIALLPVMSASLVIFAGADGVVNRALANPPMVFLGKISYSLYLFHWPIVVYFGLYIGRDFTGAEKSALFILILSLAILNWKFVETPFRTARDGRSWRMAKGAMASAAASALMLSAAIAATGGFPFRLQGEAIETNRRIELAVADSIGCASIERRNVLSKAHICGQDGNSVDYFLWGDSHAGMLGGPLSSRLRQLGLDGLVGVMAACPPLIGVYYSTRKNRAECREFAAHIEKEVKKGGVPIVVLASRWANLASNARAPGDGGLSQQIFDGENDGAPLTFDTALIRTVQRLTAAGAKVIIVGPVPEINFDVPNMMIRMANWGRPVPEVSRSAFDERQKIVLHTLRQLEDLHNVAVVYPHEQLCDLEHCRIVVDGKPLYKDDDHLTLAGVRLVLPSIVRAMEAAQVSGLD